MSFKSKKEKTINFNFLLDEFFINHGLDEIEKHSTNQDNDLESIMLSSYDILNEIYKIKANIKITEKVNQIKNISSINRYTYKSNIKNKKEKKIEKKNNSIKNKNSNSLEIYRNDFDIQKCIRQIDINSLILKKNENIYLKKDKSSNYIYLNNGQKKKMINLKKQYSSKNENKNRIINNENNSMSDKNIKKNERNKNKKINIRHFTVSLLD